MVTEQQTILQTLQTAIQMEIDGKDFYLKASRKSSNEMGKELLKQLAAEEDIHRQNFEEIYEAMRNKKDWPKTDFQPDGGIKLRTIFTRANEEIGANARVIGTELDAVQIAINMESKTYDFYKAQSKKTMLDAARDFYDALAAQEREHQLVLLDYSEYLKDPAGWFVSKEHPSLDGG